MQWYKARSELGESLLRGLALLHAQDVEADGWRPGQLGHRLTSLGALFDNGRHSPTVTMSPMSTRLSDVSAGPGAGVQTDKAGEQCTDRVLWRFSSEPSQAHSRESSRHEHRWYFGMKCRLRRVSRRGQMGRATDYSRRMTMVRVILVEMTRPVRMRPRMATSPVKGLQRISLDAEIECTRRRTTSCLHAVSPEPAAHRADAPM